MSFTHETLWLELLDSGVVDQVLSTTSLEEADSVYLREVQYSANKVVPLKTIQIRRYFLPGLSNNTNEILAWKHHLSSQIKEGGDLSTLAELKVATKQAREAIRENREQH